MIPVDVVINLTLAAGWYTAVHRWEGTSVSARLEHLLIAPGLQGEPRKKLNEALLIHFLVHIFSPRFGKD